MSSVTLKNVHKRYGKVVAVRGISMDIRDGEFIAFLGPSGCGKSSTMRMIAGLEEISEGDILFDQQSIIDKKPSQRNVAMAFETYALYPTLTVYENLAFPLRAIKTKDAEIDRRVREVAEIVGITELFDRKPGKLSSGQSQAVGLARALIRKPNVFLLDEPISHLDTSQRFYMRMYIKRLHLDLGHTMILVTHDQEDAMALADRVAVMSDGLLHQIDTPRNIFDHPADLFVASFIGNIPMNFMPGAFRQEDGKSFVQHQVVRMDITEKVNRGSFDSIPQDVILGIRPNDLRVELNCTEENAIPGWIYYVEPLGDMNVVTIKVEDLFFQVIMPTSFRPDLNSPAYLVYNPDGILLFDKHTEKAI